MRRAWVIVGVLVAAPEVWAQWARVERIVECDASVQADINNAGQVVVKYNVGAASQSLVRFSDGVGLQQLAATSTGWLSSPRINDSGQVSFSQLASGGMWVVKRYSDGAGTLELASPAGSTLVAASINNHGDVLGAGQLGGGSQSGAVYRDGLGWQGVPTPVQTWSWEVLGNNDAGQLIGSAYSYRALRYSPGSGFADLGDLGGGQAVPRGINQHGDAFGFSRTESGIDYNFVYHDGAGMTSMGTMAVAAQLFDMNNQGWVVGMFTDSPWRAFVWTEELGYVDLNGLLAPGTNAHFTMPLAVNDFGQIAAWGEVDGQFGIYRVTVNQLPSPGSLVPLVGGLVLSGRRRRGKWPDPPAFGSVARVSCSSAGP